MKARGKKPLSSMNRILREQFRDAPRAFLIRRISDVITERAPSASSNLVVALAEHLATNPTAPFNWDGPDDVDIDIKLTSDDLMPAFEAALKFVSEELPEIIPKALASAAEVIVRSLRADWPAQRQHDQMAMAGFSANLHDRWGDAFATLRMMYTISVEIGGSVAAVSCPLLSGPSTMTVWIEEGTTNACEEAQAGGDHREAA